MRTYTENGEKSQRFPGSKGFLLKRVFQDSPKPPLKMPRGCLQSLTLKSPLQLGWDKLHETVNYEA